MNKILSAIFLFASFLSYSQVRFSKLYDINNTADAGSNVLETKSYYVITGANGKSDGSTDFVLVSTLKNGDIKYKNSYSYGKKIIVQNGKTILLKNGNLADYRTLQEYDSGVNNYRTWSVLTVFNEKGDKLWSKQYKDSKIFWLSAQALVETPDSGFVLVADKKVTNTNRNPVLIRTDKNGNELFRKEIKTVKVEVIYSVVSYPSGGYVLAGAGNSLNGNLFDPWVVKVDSGLNVEWEKKYPSGRGIAAKATVLKDSNIVFSCDSTYNSSGLFGSYRAIKVNKNGAVIWDKKHFLPKESAGYIKPIELPNRSLVLLGSYWEGGATLRTLTKLTPEGDTIWMNRYYYESPNDQNYLWDFISTSDGGFLLGGDVSPTSGTGQDLWLLKVDSNGCSTPKCTSRVYDLRLGIDYRQEMNTSFKVFPNPMQNVLNIRQIDENSTNTNWKYKLLNANGKEMQSGLFENEKTLNTSNLPSGVYLLKLENGPVQKVFRVVKE